ncbi:MAG: hypothetical protein IJZ46_00460 [Bacilli bacterium]|nr:hypothetical protein [Bacilli bacterium]
MNLNEVEKLITEVTEMIKNKARYISQEEDYYKFLLAEKELEHLKEYLKILKQLQKKLQSMERINIKEYEEKITEIRKTVDIYYRGDE